MKYKGSSILCHSPHQFHGVLNDNSYNAQQPKTYATVKYYYIYTFILKT